MGVTVIQRSYRARAPNPSPQSFFSYRYATYSEARHFLWQSLSVCLSVRLSHGVARILSGVHFSLQKKLTTFLKSSPLKDGLNLLNKRPNLTRPAKKILTLAPGVHLVCCGCSYKFFLCITPKIVFFFTAISSKYRCQTQC